MTDDEVKDFVVINFGECFKSTKRMVSKLCEEQNIREVSESLLTAPNEVEKYAIMMQSNSSDNCVHHYNNKIWICLIQNYNLLTLKLWLKTKIIDSDLDIAEVY